MEPSVAADSRRAPFLVVPTAGGNVRWSVCALLFFATTINYFDRQILSLTKPILDETLGWTNEQFGYVNAAFQGAYAVGLLAFGWIVDRYGVKIGYALSHHRLEPGGGGAWTRGHRGGVRRRAGVPGVR